MDRRDTERREAQRAQRGSSGRKSRAGLASGVPGTHPGEPEPGQGFVVPPPDRTVSAEATRRAAPVDPDRGFAVPAPTRLATQTLERPSHGRHEAPVRHVILTNRLRQVPGTRRFGLAAGQVLVAMLVCLLVWTLLSAHSLHRASEASPEGARRSASLTVLGPIDAFSHLLYLDRLASVFQGAVGHDPDRVSPGGLADGPPGPPPAQPTFLPTTPPGGTAGHGQGNGHHDGQGNGNGHPTPKPSHSKPPGPGATLEPLRTPTRSKPLRTLVVGDSFAQGVEIGLAPVTDSEYFRIIQQGLQATGLSRPDYYNWPRALGVFVAQYRPDIVLIMLGGNDATTIHLLSGGKIPFGVGDPRWRETYRDRVGQMMEIASSGGAHVAWIGMPIMGRDPRFSDSMHTLDGIYEREAALHPDVLYVDSYQLFSKDGKYSDYLPDRHGTLRLVRAPDKVHFTSDGDRMLMSELINRMKFNPGWKLSRKALG